jgi:hypothetical protein
LFTEGTPLSQPRPIPFQVVVTAGKVLIVTLVGEEIQPVALVCVNS